MDQNNKLSIAIDGGGTKTECVLFDNELSVQKRVILKGSNPNIVGVDKACEVIDNGISELLADSDIKPVGIFAGVSGAMSANRGEAMKLVLRDKYPSIEIESDIMNVIFSASNPGKCVAAIVGTGSSVFAYDGHGVSRAGGWGYLFDNAGSGYDIGREVIRTCLACNDGAIKSSRLIELAEKKIGGRALDKLNLFYENGRDYIASFAPVAFQAMREGDKGASEIIETSIRRVAELIVFVHGRYDCGNTAVISGGLVHEREILEPRLKSYIGAGISLEFPDQPQIYGAMRRCLSLQNS